MSGDLFHSPTHSAGLLNIDEVGDLLGLTREAIYARRHRADFPPAIRMGNVLRWKIEDIDAWLDERREVEQ